MGKINANTSIIISRGSGSPCSLIFMMFNMASNNCQKIKGKMKNGRKVKMPSKIFCVLLNSIVNCGRGYLQNKIINEKKRQKKTALSSSLITISDGLIFVIASAVKTATATTAFVAATSTTRSVSARSCFVNHQGLSQEIETV